jgi:oligoendopeptidase F
MTGWHRKLHIFRSPFYYVDYGVAQLGAVQIWKRALDNPEEATARYRHALSLGGTVSLPELFEAAGAKLAFDAATLADAVALIERTIEGLSAEV